MKWLTALMMLTVPAGMACAGQAGDPACSVQGDRFAWTTDYCLALNQTDDESLAGSCIDQELQRRFVNVCESVSYYKQGMCGLAIQQGSYAGSAEECVADGGFSGPTVRRKAAAATEAPASATPPP